MNLLTEPVFRAQTTAGLTTVSLPGLLAALGADEVESLPGLQRHQEDAFHIFLCYLAGAVLTRAGSDDPVQPEAFWRNGLRQLAGREDDCAWTLVVEDVTQPAFMQAPLVSKTAFDAFGPKADTPDGLDVLQTAKNHDVKSQRAQGADFEDWTYALISLQTMTGLMGRGNYGIARMNSGTGSRVCVGLLYSERLGGRWLRDTRKLLAYRAELLAGAWQYCNDGLVLVWLRSWDLKTPLPLSELDPFFIEIARAVRLIWEDGRIKALGTGTEGSRLAAKMLKGIVGDPWTPLVDDGKEKKAWTVMAPFFSPGRLRNLLFEEEGFVAPTMQKPDRDTRQSACQLRASVLAPGGMGKTDGFHEAMVRIPAPAATRLFQRGPERDRLAKLSGQGINDAGLMQNKVLKPSLLTFLESGPDQINFDKREFNAWLGQAHKDFGTAWTTDFFDWLWLTVDQPDQNSARVDWLKSLEEKARTVLKATIARLPAHSGRQYRARTQAEAVFTGCLFKTFPELKEIAHAEHRPVATGD